MNNTQRILLVVYLPLTVLILIFQMLYQKGDPALYLMFAVRVTMFLSVVVMLKRIKEQILIMLAFLFTIVSDYYFVYARTLDQPIANRELYGMLGFIAAYLCLIAAFNKNFKIGKAELITLFPFVGIYTCVFLSLQQYAKGFMYPAAIITGIILCFAGMTMVSTLFRGYFSKKLAWMIALAGCMMFISDMFVAYSIFHPDFKEFILWKENLIWGTYVPAWTFLMIVVAEY
ncbi:MAG: lysoplasmalogenase family protein [Bacillota bacterium]|jgi:hypothetical protein